MINTLHIVAASLCLSQCLEVSVVPGGDLCSAWKSKWRDFDCRSLHFFTKLLFGNTWLSKFQYLPEDVEHQWICCHYMRELQLVFLRPSQAPVKAPLQMSSLKQDLSHTVQWPGFMWASLLRFEQWVIHMDSQCSPKALGCLFHPCWHSQFSQPGWPFICCVSCTPVPHHTMF